jgi:hypothetical protein
MSHQALATRHASGVQKVLTTASASSIIIPQPCCSILLAGYLDTDNRIALVFLVVIDIRVHSFRNRSGKLQNSNVALLVRSCHPLQYVQVGESRCSMKQKSVHYEESESTMATTLATGSKDDLPRSGPSDRCHLLCPVCLLLVLVCLLSCRDSHQPMIYGLCLKRSSPTWSYLLQCYDSNLVVVEALSAFPGAPVFV